MATEKERVREKEIVVWFSSGFVMQILNLPEREATVKDLLM